MGTGNGRNEDMQKWGHTAAQKWTKWGKWVQAQLLTKWGQAQLLFFWPAWTSHCGSKIMHFYHLFNPRLSTKRRAFVG